ncbi:uncharacterized protein LOC135498210 [Lineus longissimus]|uniref:uncharacterized protein LOC135498210 n=1 Tax=Lineus longissimus TaxID=88925 RepID=UPI002B4EDC19
MSKLYRRIATTLCAIVGTFIIFQFMTTFCFNNHDKKDSIQFKNDIRTHNQRRNEKRVSRGVYSEDITIVTAYFDLGTFRKGNKNSRIFTKQMYERRLGEYGRLMNNVVAFFDDKHIYETFKTIRATQEKKTKIFLINRKALRSFQVIDKVREILSYKGYPQFHPNTVVPEYGCSMNAKYELVELAAKENVFNTSYFAWFDGGFFQNQTDHLPFKLATPPGFDQSKVGYGQMLPLNSKLSPQEIFLTNQYSLCGCVFIARRDVMLRWTKLYRFYADLFLNRGLASTDEQVLYAMFSDKIDKPTIRIQRYWERPAKNVWSVLGYVMKDSWKNHQLGNTA